MARLQCSRQSARKKKEHLRIRRELLALFRDYARRQGLHYYHVSQACGFSQPRAWNLLNGPMEQFNSETLINVLARFGFALELVVKEHRPAKIWYPYAKYEEFGADLYPAVRGLPAREAGSRRRL